MAEVSGERIPPKAVDFVGQTNEDPRVMEKWESMVKRDLPDFMRRHYTTFVRRVRRGVPQKYRWEAWKAAACYKDKFTQGVYSDYCDKPNQFSSLIRIDTPRTFPEFAKFDKEAQEQLFRVLNCFVNLNPQVGYCQGMNFIAGLLLIVSDFKEEETYWMLVCLMDHYGLEGFYREKFPLLRLYLNSFDVLAARVIPEVKEHFDKEGVFPAVYLHQWLLTVFINCLPFPTVVILWDFLICRGLPGMLQITIALLYVLRSALLHLQFEDIVRFLKSMRSNDDCNDVIIGKLLVRQAERVVIDQELEATLMEFDLNDLLRAAEEEEEMERKTAAQQNAAAANGGGSDEAGRGAGWRMAGKREGGLQWFFSGLQGLGINLNAPGSKPAQPAFTATTVNQLKKDLPAEDQADL